MYCLETENLTHRFSERETILQAINLQVSERSIYGFLGPNGAGKTTTLKLVLGLLRRQEGSISIFNKPFEKHRVEILNKVGSLIESPSLYGQLTAIENLAVLQKIYQCPKERIPEVLALVGLSNTGNKKASQFSLGMKQRLSIAIALLNQPQLLILDEPTNGLDPNGIIEVRELLIRLNQELGTTIVISSHLLSEIEKLVTHLGIISKGRLVFQGTMNELIRRQQSYITIETDNNERVLQILSANNLTSKSYEGKIVVPVNSREKIAKINEQLVAGGVAVYSIGIIKNDLESIFMDIIKT